MTYKENTNQHINGIIIKAKQGDGKAINTLLKELEPYVEEVLRCNGFKTELQDKTKKRNLIAWGQEGLYDAIRKFDFSFGVQFKTYAVQYILKMPRAEAQADRKWYARLHGEYNQNMGTEDEDEYAETQESPEVSEEDETPKTAYLPEVSKSGIPYNKTTYPTEIPDDFDGYESRFMQQDIKMALDGINPTDAKVIRMAFGINCKEHTGEEIGRELGRTRQRADERKKRGLKLLAKSPYLRPYGDCA